MCLDSKKYLETLTRAKIKKLAGHNRLPGSMLRDNVNLAGAAVTKLELSRQNMTNN